MILGRLLDPFQLRDELARGQQRDGMQRACYCTAWCAFRRTCKPRRQNDEPARTEGDSRCYRRVARNRSVAKKPAIDLDRRKSGRDRTAGQDRRRRRTARQHHGLARKNIGCDDVHGDGRVLQVAIGQMMLEKTSEAVGGHEMAAAANKAQQPPPGPWKDVGALEPTPETFQFGNSLQGWISGKVGAVDGADARSNDHVGFNSAFEQSAQHPDLNRPQAPAARQDKGRFRVRCRCAHDTLPIARRPAKPAAVTSSEM